MDRNKAIGIFDSGIGGLTVANAISELLPNEQIIYLGDTEHMPYGEKSHEAILHFSSKITSFLLEQECKAVIIACNTASTLSFDNLNNEFGHRTRIYNVVDPIVDAVIKDSSCSNIGIIGTKQTIKSNVYESRLLQKNPDLKITSFATPLLAQMIEEGFYNCEISKLIVKRYLDKAHFDNCDGLILACTHYPLIKDDVKELYGQHLSIFDSTMHIAEYVRDDLEEMSLLAEKKHGEDHFYVSDLTDLFSLTARKFYKKPLKLEKVHLWEDMMMC